MKYDFGELLTAMVTPMQSGGHLNLDKTVELANYLLKNGTDSLLILGTTGETPTLSHNEKLLLMEVLVDELKGKTKIVAGTGSYNTKETIAFSREAREIGVDGIMVVVPYYNKPPQRALYEHFRIIAEDIKLPIIIYNVPGRTATNLENDTILKLAKIDNIVAIKEASGDMGRISDLAAKKPANFEIYSGDDNLTLPILSVGGKGVVSVAAHLVGKEIKEMIQSYKKGNVKQAAQINNKLSSIFQGIFIDTNPIPIKAALNMIGFDVGTTRLPLLNLESENQLKINSILKEHHLI